MKPAPFDYARAGSLEEAIGLLAAADGEARPLAGGQSLGPMLNLRIARPALLVDLSPIEELRDVSEDADGVTIGASVVHAAIEDGEVPDVTHGLMRRAAAGIAYRAVRNRGTVGGSLAHADPAGDWAPVMMALGASLGIRGPEGGRSVDADAFVTDPLTTVLEPGEIVEAIRIPRLSEGARWGHYKLCVKPGDFAESLAVVVRDADRGHCRAALAGPTHAPILLDRVAGLIAGADGWSDALAGGIKDAASGEIKAAGFADAEDRYAMNVHATAAVRAAREAFSR
ncbi:MAG: FAD binding domain-containing protein [Defluviicoccus sp.]|nr:FAD binding domain-containing protein [Defluviicoccus sp.]